MKQTELVIPIDWRWECITNMIFITVIYRWSIKYSIMVHLYNLCLPFMFQEVHLYLLVWNRSLYSYTVVDELTFSMN